MNKKIIKLSKLILSVLNGLIPKKNNRVLFKSVPDYAGNCKALSDYILKEHPEYEVVWLYSKYKSDEGRINWVKKGTFLGYWYVFTSKYIVTTHNEMIGVKAFNQVYLSLWHGMPLKKVCYLADKEVMLMESFSAKRIATSEIMRSIIASAFNERVDNVIVTGQPRNDFLFDKKDFDFLSEREYKKIVLFAPTFRQNSYVHDKTDGAKIENANFLRVQDFDLGKLQEFLKLNDVLLLVKLHPFEENALNGIEFPDNIKIIKSEGFNSHGYDINHLLAISDCLITDYSSIYFDYLILNKPIGFLIPDCESYINSRGGFTLEPISFWMPGEKLSLQCELIDFLNTVLIELKDSHILNRTQVNDALNTYKDGFNSKRVFDIFINGR
ncbi:CDP-glycerol glycerophosphotransferase family protein [Pseudocitrobacter faecalis]|uniref:CDP-glycerol glycerophosphotransferase family protein n=1 Tax=Pseudocitrobacter faecalis TaxID=1398493 RepID=UPI003BA251E9